MTSVRKSLIYFVAFAVFAVAGGVFIGNGIVRPVSGQTVAYTADFTDASGLRVGNDVRTLGTRVGKVTGVDLQRRDGASYAQVRFTLQDDQHLYADSKLAIRYLNLTGIRYLDLQQRQKTRRPLAAGATLGTDSTIPSFDITTVFHGLAPLFAVMNPDDINHFSESLLALVEGDGSGFGPLIDALTKVLTFVDDRSKVVDLLVTNLTEVSAALGGRAGNLAPLLSYLNALGDRLIRRLPDLRDLADTSGAVLISANRLLGAIGLKDGQTPDLNALVRQAMPALQSVVGLLALTPGVLNALNAVLPPAPGAAPVPAAGSCSKGRVELPTSIEVFIRGTQVTLCKR